jgi:crotonobetainyl-CoA:carnitine CoA-transferase CaiB-like acyl-CoA transferase
MRPGYAQSGSREVEPAKRKRKVTPSDRVRKAKRLTQRIETAVRDRHEAWAEGDQAPVVGRRTDELDQLHGDKRVMRRELYDRAPALEGRDVRRGNPAGGAR